MHKRSKPHRSVGKVVRAKSAPSRTSVSRRPFNSRPSEKGSWGKGLRLAGSSYVTHAELLRLAVRNHCLGIQAEPVLALCRPGKNFWVFKATVYKSARCRGFVGYGDAHPGNVSPLIFHHAELRMAETRAVNRALRKAYGIGLCSLEDLPPWRLTAEQIAWLGRTLRMRPAFPKGAPDAHQNSRPQPDDETKSSRRGSVPRSRGSPSDPPATPLSPAWRPRSRFSSPRPTPARYIRTARSIATTGRCGSYAGFCGPSGMTRNSWRRKSWMTVTWWAWKGSFDWRIGATPGAVWTSKASLSVSGGAIFRARSSRPKAPPKWRRFKSVLQEGRELWIITATRSFPPICNVR
jgi:hypothetical protein